MWTMGSVAICGRKVCAGVYRKAEGKAKKKKKERRRRRRRRQREKNRADKDG